MNRQEATAAYNRYCEAVKAKGLDPAIDLERWIATIFGEDDRPRPEVIDYLKSLVR